MLHGFLAGLLWLIALLKVDAAVHGVAIPTPWLAWTSFGFELVIGTMLLSKRLRLPALWFCLLFATIAVTTHWVNPGMQCGCLGRVRLGASDEVTVASVIGFLACLGLMLGRGSLRRSPAAVAGGARSGVLRAR